MTYTVVHGRRSMQIATGRMVIPPNEVESFTSALQCAGRLNELLDQESARVDAARAAGWQQGFATGRAEGERAAQAAFVDAASRLASEGHHHQRAAREAVATLALAVVRKLSLALSAHEVVPALLEQALVSLTPTPANRVRVHPAVAEAVRKRLDAIETPLDVLPDDALAPFDCVLESAAGDSLVGADAQLIAIARALNADVSPLSAA